MTIQPHFIEGALTNFFRFFNKGEFINSAKELNELLFRLFVEIYLEAKREGSDSFLRDVTTYEQNKFNNGQFEKITLGELLMLFQDLQILDKATGDESSRKLLKVFNLNEIANISEQSLIYDDAWSEKYLIIIYEFILGLLSFKGWKTEKRDNVIIRKFELDLSTGIMTNPHDLTRNVSFKAVTFSVMIGHICTEVVNRVLVEYSTLDGSQDAHHIEESINKILFDSGYTAGSNFGLALSLDFEKETPVLPLHKRIKLWCEFDTSVGWGKFEDDLIVDEATRRVSGRIVLRSNFLVTEKKRTDFNLCSLMKGYICGVLEKLLQFPVNIVHDKHAGHCSQFTENKLFCDFFVADAQPK